MNPPTASHALDLNLTANLLRLLGHPVRLSICLLLLESERTVAFIESSLELRQPNLSQHLAVLRDAGIVTSRREAKSVTYTIASGLPLQLIGALAHLPEGGAAMPQGGRTPATMPPPPPARHARNADEDALMFAMVKLPVSARQPETSQDPYPATLPRA